MVMFTFSCTPLVNKFSFFPDRANAVPDGLLPQGIEHRYIRAAGRLRLECYYCPAPGARNLVIYFHGNGGNISQRLPELVTLRSAGVNVLGLGYRGYGRSTGRPSEAGIYRDGESAIVYATDSLGFALENVFLMGRSIGSTVAVAAAQKKRLAGVILVTPLSSGKEYAAAHGMGWLSFMGGNCFDNVGKAKYITAPVLVIHGTGDEVVPYRCGQKLYGALPGKKTFVTIKGGLHNSLEVKDPKLYWGSIVTFLMSRTSLQESNAGE